jgi:hypothetical protein
MSASGSNNRSTSVQYDLTSGQDAAHKLGQEKSALQAKQLADLYNMDDLGGVLASTNRIRDIQKYLMAGGYEDMEVIPRRRVGGITESSSESISRNQGDR